MTDIAQNQLVADVAHDIIVQTVPQELPVFQETCEAYFRNPKKLLKSQNGKDERLGFGAQEIVTTVITSPVVLAIVNEAIKALAEEVKDSNMMKKLSSKLFANKEDKKLALPLTQNQLQQVSKSAHTKALDLGLSPKDADELSDAIVARLALGNS